MSVGFDSETNIVNKGDTANLVAYLYDVNNNALTDADLVSVSFNVQKPDGTTDSNLLGIVQSDGSGALSYTNTAQQGKYIAVATFTLSNGNLKSTRVDFEVQDPFNPPAPTLTQVIQAKVWNKLQDCFDSNDGGPWLRDMTLAVFNIQRIADFMDEAVFDINMYNPPTQLSVNDFAAVADQPLLAEATFMAVIRHLMRSYTEQPAPQGGQVTYEDRRDYQQRWGTIYQIELKYYEHLVFNWKRKYFGFGQTAGLVSSKAGRLLPAPLRSRGIGRGYY